MDVFFLDSSAVIKRYVQETGTAWLRPLIAPDTGSFLFIARITDVEVTAAIARRRKGRSITPDQASAALQQFQLDLDQDYRVVELTLPLLKRAATLADRHHLRAYDAVQLAAGLELHAQMPNTILLSADTELNAAAIAEGMVVDDPNRHP